MPSEVKAISIVVCGCVAAILLAYGIVKAIAGACRYMGRDFGD